MNDDPVSLHFQTIRQQIARLQQEESSVWAGIDSALEDLHVMYEEMQANSDAAMLSAQQQLQQSQHYYDLFHNAPLAYLVTDAAGVILEANKEIAKLLGVPQPYLSGKPLSLYIAKGDRTQFRARLNQLPQRNETQVWPLNLSPRSGAPFAAQLQVAVSRTAEGRFESLRIGVFPLHQPGQAGSTRAETALPAGVAQQTSDSGQAEETPALALPPSLDGLRVLVVDDEARICEFITALLESHGIEVKAVTSSAAALEEVERFYPDVLLSDIRLPGGDGYDLIRLIRALEMGQGRHIYAAAITAYLDEDHEKALNAGYEAYWYKLSQPTELVEVVVQLAERAIQDRP
jgi:PAS domain S-box-containing protein